MKLPFSSIDDISIDRTSGVKSQTMNNVYARLIQNDNALRIDQTAWPTVWEQRWYNSQTDRSLYYRKGDAVWVNTEDINSFTETYEKQIIRYGSYDSQLATVFNSLSGDANRQARLAICKQLVNGTYDNGKGPMFFLGDIKRRAQIRISLSDDNAAYPDNDKYWADYFYNYTLDDIKGTILSAFDSEMSSIISTHVNGYHTAVGKNISDVSSEYMLADMSNALSVQRFTGHQSAVGRNVGFDCVTGFFFKDFGGGVKRWYRTWSSGMLEHGGTIVKNHPIGSDSADGFAYEVGFKWETTPGVFSPVFDYVKKSFSGFYGNDINVKRGHTATPIGYVDISPDDGYSIQLTEINTASPYSYFDTDDGVFIQPAWYAANNMSFKFTTTSANAYSFCVRGYSKATRRF